MPDVPGREHRLFRDLYVTRGTLHTRLARGGGAARELVARVGAPGCISVKAPTIFMENGTGSVISPYACVGARKTRETAV